MAGSARSNVAGKKAEKSLSERMQAWKQRKESTGVAWREVDCAVLKGAIHAILSSDCAVMFARARGGDGVMVKVYDEGTPASEFAATAVELEELLMGLVEVFGNTSEDIIAAMACNSESTSLAAD